MVETHIVAYDIRHPKRLRRVAKTCQDFGCRRQLSIFLCRISPLDVVRLKARLNQTTEDWHTAALFERSSPVHSERSRTSGEVEERMGASPRAFDFAALRSGRTETVSTASEKVYESLVV